MTSFLLAPDPDPAIAQDGARKVVFAFERPQDGPAVDALVDRAFGPGRLAKTAERIRERSKLRADLSVCAWADEGLAGAVRQWAICVGGTDGLFLGPIAVDAAQRRAGLGAALMQRAIAAAQGAGERLILLVGDGPFFAQFGFEPAPPSRISLPGPVDPRRVLWLALAPGATDGVSGFVCGRGAASP